MAGETEAPRRAHRRHRWIWVTAAAVVGVVLVVTAIGWITPWPSAMLIRAVFTQGGDATVAEMQPHVPDDPQLREVRDVAYGDDSGVTTLDVFTQAAEGERRPTVVWIHGGAWISGSTGDVEPYLRILAAHGYTTIGVGYGLGPEETYPTAVHQLNDALAYLDAHAAEFSVDTTQIVIAGDSAGGQLASQMATLITNPQYAHLLGIRPALDADQLAGALLNCGVYDLRAMAELQGLAAWGFKVALWAYTGEKDWSETASGATMSTIDFVTADFPPTYISGGNGDALTWLQSIPMAQRLESLGVDVTTLFWPAPHEPQLPHEYQFHLDLPEAQTALEKTVAWLDANTDMP